jgi:pimeloyl-ACP methyl ester carboxylesterase
MTEDVLTFIDEHGLKEPILIGHSMYVIRDSCCKYDRWLILLRGAKTAMAVALRFPEIVAKIVAVDNAPTDTTLSSSFATYVRGMKKIQEAKVTRQSEADAILKDYEEVNISGALYA